MRFNPYNLTSKCNPTAIRMCAVFSNTCEIFTILPSPAEGGGNYVIRGLRLCGGCFEPLNERRKPWRWRSPHQLSSQGSAMSSVRHRWISLSFYPMLCRFPLLIWCLSLRRDFPSISAIARPAGGSYDCRWYCTRYV